jgi:hypothetical protein
MAKSKRASSRKANNQKLQRKVFGPVEAARIERLSAKLLELAAQPNPKPEAGPEKPEAAMEVDQGLLPPPIPSLQVSMGRH